MSKKDKAKRLSLNKGEPKLILAELKKEAFIATERDF